MTTATIKTEIKQARSAPEGHCPFCFEKSIGMVTDCFDVEGKKICELWFCRDCGGFFPRMLKVEKTSNVALGEKSGAALPEADGDKDQRRSPRFPVQFVVQVDFAGVAPKKNRSGIFGRRRDRMSEPIVAMVMNAGMGGLCFRYPSKIKEGKEAEMKISLPSVQKSFSATGRVVRSTRLPDGSFGLGIQFVRVEPEYREALQRYVTLD